MGGLTDLNCNSSETPSQFLEHVSVTMRSFGIGAKTHFHLSWNPLIVILTLKGLSNDIMTELLKKFNRSEVSVEELSSFLDNLSTAKSMTSSGSSVNKIENKGRGKGKKHKLQQKKYLAQLWLSLHPALHQHPNVVDVLLI